MSFALRTSFGKVCGVSKSLAHFPRSASVVRATSVRRSLNTRAMAAQSDVKLDKQTPDSKWKEILSAEEVCKISLFRQTCVACI